MIKLNKYQKYYIKELNKSEKQFNKIINNLYLKPFKFNEQCVLPKDSLYFGLLYHNKYGSCIIYYNKKASKDEIPYKNK